MELGDTSEEQPISRHRVIHARQRHEEREQAPDHRDDDHNGEDARQKSMRHVSTPEKEYQEFKFGLIPRHRRAVGAIGHGVDH